MCVLVWLNTRMNELMDFMCVYSEENEKEKENGRNIRMYMRALFVSEGDRDILFSFSSIVSYLFSNYLFSNY